MENISFIYEGIALGEEYFTHLVCPECNTRWDIRRDEA
jgi:hypothetical protein